MSIWSSQHEDPKLRPYLAIEVADDPMKPIIEIGGFNNNVRPAMFKNGNAAAVINTSNDDVQTGDMIFIDIDGAGTGAKGLQVLLTFQLP